MIMSCLRGHKILWMWRLKKWVYADNKKSINKSRPCKNCCEFPILVKVKIPADLSSTGEEEWKIDQIDACIAPIVKALQEGEIDMRGSCCGHGIMDGDIHLQDVIILIIKKDGDKYLKKRS